MTQSNWNTGVVSSSRKEGDSVIIAVQGEVDLHNSPDLRAALLSVLSPVPKRLILNLASVPYMDSSAVAVLVEALQKLRPSGGKVMLVCLQPRVKGLLEIARLDSIFTLATDEQQALAM
jgi:anti-sigma B factor antagonist